MFSRGRPVCLPRLRRVPNHRGRHTGLPLRWIMPDYFCTSAYQGLLPSAFEPVFGLGLFGAGAPRPKSGLVPPMDGEPPRPESELARPWGAEPPRPEFGLAPPLDGAALRSESGRGPPMATRRLSCDARSLRLVLKVPSLRPDLNTPGAVGNRCQKTLVICPANNKTG